MTKLSWLLTRLDEAAARIGREASGKCDRLIAEMDDIDTRTGMSRYEFRRIWFPRILADLDEVGR